MSPDETPQQPMSPTPRFVSPSMQPAIPMTPSPSTWPAVIGIIAIVWAALYLLGGLCLLSGGIFSFVSWVMHTNVPAPDMSLAIRFGAVMSLVLKSCLMILGIGLVRRRFWAAHWFRVWAVVEMVAFVAGAVIGHMMYQQQLATMAHQRIGHTPVFAWGCSLLLAWTLPVFVLIWFSRSKIKQEVATWQVLPV